MNIEQLVTEVQQGKDSQRAFAEVCQRFTGLVKKYAHQPHLTGLTEEATAEGWLAVVAAVQTYKPDGGSYFAGYVESKVKYAVWNLFKRERRRWQQELPLTSGNADSENSAGMDWLATIAADDNVEVEAQNNYVSSEISRALAALPAKQHQAVVRTLLQEERLADLADELGISPQAVYGLRQRGLTHLRREVTASLR